MAIEKLMDIRQRLSALVQTSSEGGTENPMNGELTGIVQALDSAIAELWLQPPANTAQELLRTTSKPLEPPQKPGPHHITYGFKGPES